MQFLLFMRLTVGAGLGVSLLILYALLSIASAAPAPGSLLDVNKSFEANKSSRNWAFEFIPEEDVERILREAFEAQKIWMKKPEAVIDQAHFSCRALRLKRPSRTALIAFNEADRLEWGPDAKLKYIEAAKEGYWRAAARLVSLNFQDGLWENATPSIAWLLNEKVPAGYNKMAEIVEIRFLPFNQAYEPLMQSFRWRAALQGDPVSLKQVADYVSKQGDVNFEKVLRDCSAKNKRSLG